MVSGPSTNTQKLTESGLARLLNVSRQAVHDLVKRGILNKDAAGLIDVAKAQEALANSVHPSSKTAAALQSSTSTKDKSPADSKPHENGQNVEVTSYHVAKTLREAAEAQIARLKLAEMQGDVIRIAAVQTQLATVFATVRDALLQIPARMAPVLAAETDPVAVHNVLHAEIHQALQHLAGASDRLKATAAET